MELPVCQYKFNSKQKINSLTSFCIFCNGRSNQVVFTFDKLFSFQMSTHLFNWILDLSGTKDIFNIGRISKNNVAYLGEGPVLWIVYTISICHNIEVTQLNSSMGYEQANSLLVILMHGKVSFLPFTLCQVDDVVWPKVTTREGTGSVGNSKRRLLPPQPSQSLVFLANELSSDHFGSSLSLLGGLVGLDKTTYVVLQDF